jgi:AraC-like DNA-binding protein
MPRRVFEPLPRRTPTRREPVTVELYHPPADAIIRRHHHTYGQLACPTAGGLRITASGMSWIVPVFRAVWIPPGFEHEVVMLGRVEFHAIYVAPSAAPLSLKGCGVVEVSPLMRELMQTLVAHEKLSSRRRVLCIQLLLEEARAASPLALGLPLPSDSRLKALCNALMEDPASTRGLPSWGRIVGSSERTLARLFHDDLQTSFGAWRLQLRLGRALDLISRGQPIALVAAELGYSTPAAFSTMFKRVLGVSPSRFPIRPGSTVLV